jgi:hypothetical protein
MRYNGSFMLNFEGAVKSKDLTLQEDLILDEIADLIESNPSIVAECLRQSNVKVSQNPSKTELINLVSKQLFDNFVFRDNIGGLIAMKGKYNTEYSNANGEFWDKIKAWWSERFDRRQHREANKADRKDARGEGSSEGKQGQVQMGTDAVSAIAGAIGSVFSFATSAMDQKARAEEARMKLAEKVLAPEKKTQWLPIVIIGGVLIIGGIVAFMTLRQKK